jgi:fibronectin type 3 domain-containing protein
VDTYVAPTTKYYYAVESFNPLKISSAPSAAVDVVTAAIPSPSALTADSVLKTSVGLSWKAVGAANGSGYRVLKGTSPSGLQIVQSKISGTTWADTPVTPGTTYYYQVETVDSMGYTSTPTPTLKVTTPQ